MGEGVDRDDPAVLDTGDPIGEALEARVVGDDDDGAALLGGQGAQQVHDAERGLGVERGGGLVAEDDGRVAAEGAGDASSLVVLYRPNSKTSVEQSVAISDGRATWIPTSPGLASLDLLDHDKTSLAKRTVSIRFAETSYVGLAVMILAAVLLFGGAAISIRALLRS